MANNPILEFAKNKATAGVPTSSKNSLSDNPILNFANKKSSSPDQGTSSSALNNLLGKDAANLPRTVDDARKLQKENPTVWQRISKELMKPVGVVATLTEQTGLALGGLARGENIGEVIKETPGKIGGIITGTRQNSFTDIWSNYGDGVVSPTVGKIIGLVSDIAADPLNFVGGGLTRAGKVADKFSELQKVGETVKAGSKLQKEMQALGLSEDLLKIGATKAEQVQKGQRAVLSLFANTRFEKTLLKGESFYRGTGAIKTALGNTLKTTKVGRVLKEVFSTKTADEGFNVVKSHFDNLYEYRKGEVMDEFLKNQNKVANLTKEEAYKIADVIESGNRSGVSVIDDVADAIATNLKIINNTEKKVGLRFTELQDYFPHIKVKENISIKERMARLFSDPKKYTTALGAKYERKVLKFTGSQGDELIGKADDLGLRKLTEKEIKKLSNKAGEAKGLFDNVSARNLSTDTDVVDALRTLKSESFVNKAGKVNLEAFDEVNQLIEKANKAGGKLLGPDEIRRARELINLSDNAIKSKALGLAQKYESGFDFIDKAGKLYKSNQTTINEVNKMFGTDFFQNNAAVAFAERALASARAVTSKEFFDSIKQFAVHGADEGVEVTARGLEGLKFAPDVAKQIDNYSRALKPDEIKVALRAFDNVQNLWKAQALVAPSYHIRNMVGNMWNNFLGGVYNPRVYAEAGLIQKGKAINFIDDIGRNWTTQEIIKAAKKSGVLNRGWFAKDIDIALSSEFGGASWNPIKQNFGLFKANRAAGEVLENNARLAHFIQRLKEGNTIDNAAISVKKYLFDYADLTNVEKNFMKRVMPFYTWTRKNIPLQFEKALKEPWKFVAIPKTTKAIESSVEKPNEKYLGDYIRNNIGIRVGEDGKGNTHYFLLGNWLPAAQAIDFLSQPVENFTMMISPFFKTPVEMWSNKSSFFEDTLGQPSPIERYAEENTSWLGVTMRKKTNYILKNIRILNELDKLNPGSIFGDKDNPSLLNRIAPEAGFKLPFGIGHITTSDKRGGKMTPDTTGGGRVLQSLFGKEIPYNPSFSKKFYLWDTDTKVKELEKAIKDAKRDGQKSYAKRLHEELKKFKKSR